MNLDRIEEACGEDVAAIAQAIETKGIAKALEANLPTDMTFVVILSQPRGAGACVTFAGNVDAKMIAGLLESVAASIRAREEATH